MSDARACGRDESGADGAGSTARRVVRWALAAALASAIGAFGCGPGEARAPNPTRPLDERRAIEVIRRAVQTQGGSPAPARDVKLTTGKELHVDVSVEGHDYGIAYITLDDAQRLGSAIPPPNRKDERLRLVRGGDDGETHLVLLYQDNYLYDDQVGDAHEQTTISAERALGRDVEDFITHARAQKYR
jgi:hypothetical protein